MSRAVDFVVCFCHRSEAACRWLPGQAGLSARFGQFSLEKSAFSWLVYVWTGQLCNRLCPAPVAVCLRFASYVPIWPTLRNARNRVCCDRGCVLGHCLSARRRSPIRRLDDFDVLCETPRFPPFVVDGLAPALSPRCTGCAR